MAQVWCLKLDPYLKSHLGGWAIYLETTVRDMFTTNTVFRTCLL